ncbi:MAG: hypothetical protein U1E51_06865 [Candidatus Binatia bacterium]|nr:hypothetical protein [Candidatus Binatia bacterium]
MLSNIHYVNIIDYKGEFGSLKGARSFVVGSQRHQHHGLELEHQVVDALRPEAHQELAFIPAGCSSSPRRAIDQKIE